MAAESYEFDVEDIEFLRHGDQPLLMRIYKPRGAGPFPAMIEVHGGAWYMFDRTRGKPLHEALARGGIVVAAVDFRQGRDGAYPRSVADINYAIRWVKAHAAEFKTRPDMLGISGNSSGGHLALLVAMRPNDPRYNAIPLPDGKPAADASVRCVLAFWPVSNPLSRYRMNLPLSKGANPPESSVEVVESSEKYWSTQDNMADGSPVLMLERGEEVSMPPVLLIQPNKDDSHNYRDPESSFSGTEQDRLAARYKAAGGDISLRYFDAPRLFVTSHPEIPESLKALEEAVAFVHKHIPSK